MIAFNIFMILLFLIYQHITYYPDFTIDVNIIEDITRIPDFNYSFSVNFITIFFIIPIIAIVIIISSINVAASGLTDSGTKKFAFIIVYVFFFVFITVVNEFFFDSMDRIGSFLVVLTYIVLSLDGLLKLGGLYSDE